MRSLATLAGLFIVVAVLADMVGTLVNTTSLKGRWWLSRVFYRNTWKLVRTLALALPEGRARHMLLATYAPLTVLGLLILWVSHQVVGFGLMWWGLGSVDGADGLVDHLYYSGVVFFTVGFGEVVPAGTVPRFGALIEAFCGVLTTALVIGYLPALYGAYSQREQKLMTLDDGSEGRIIPTNLVMAWAPNGDIDELESHFEGWSEWMSTVLESHSTFPMLRYFRSQHPQQNWVTAVGLVADAALHCLLIRGTDGRASVWALRQSIALLDELVDDGEALDVYRRRFDEASRDDGLFVELHDALSAHGFDVLPLEEATARARRIRPLYDAKLEHLIDELVAPRGFWARSIGWTLLDDGGIVPLEDRVDAALLDED